MKVLMYLVILIILFSDTVFINILPATMVHKHINFLGLTLSFLSFFFGPALRLLPERRYLIPKVQYGALILFSGSGPSSGTLDNSSKDKPLKRRRFFHEDSPITRKKTVFFSGAYLWTKYRKFRSWSRECRWYLSTLWKEPRFPAKLCYVCIRVYNLP